MQHYQVPQAILGLDFSELEKRVAALPVRRLAPAYRFTTGRMPSYPPFHALAEAQARAARVKFRADHPEMVGLWKAQGAGYA